MNFKGNNGWGLAQIDHGLHVHSKIRDQDYYWMEVLKHVGRKRKSRTFSCQTTGTHPLHLKRSIELRALNLQHGCGQSHRNKY